jgi:hypothetical protein
MSLVVTLISLKRLIKVSFPSLSSEYLVSARAIVVADPVARSDKRLKKKVMEAINKNGPKEGTLELDNAKVFLCKYNHGDAEKDLNWAVKFWKKEREAIPTQNLNKCKTCGYYEKCGCLCLP